MVETGGRSGEDHEGRTEAHRVKRPRHGWGRGEVALAVAWPPLFVCQQLNV